MLKKVILALTLFALFAFLPSAVLAAPNLKDGEWEITMTTQIKGMPQMKGMPAMRPVTYKQCITQQDAVPQPREKNRDCKVKDQKILGNTVSWEMVCNDKDGAEMTSTGKITYKGDRFDGTMKSTMTGKETGQMEINQKMTGKRLGPCPQ